MEKPKRKTWILEWNKRIEIPNSTDAQTISEKIRRDPNCHDLKITNDVPLIEKQLTALFELMSKESYKLFNESVVAPNTTLLMFEHLTEKNHVGIRYSDEKNGMFIESVKDYTLEKKIVAEIKLKKIENRIDYKSFVADRIWEDFRSDSFSVNLLEFIQHFDLRKPKEIINALIEEGLIHPNLKNDDSMIQWIKEEVLDNGT